MVTMKQLLEAGVHFGHQTKRWNPKMKPFIFGARNGIYIIDLQQTVQLYKKAYKKIVDTVSGGGTVLFVGTKRQAAGTIRDEANRCGMFFVNHRWLGGMLTNLITIRQSVDKLKKLNEMKAKEDWGHATKKEILQLEKTRIKLDRNLGGVMDMEKLPAAIFMIDPHRERIAALEARRLGIPIIGVVDTNCDPDMVDFIIPGNDDAIRAIKLFAGNMADAVMLGKSVFEDNVRQQKSKAPVSEMAKQHKTLPTADALTEDGPEGVEISVMFKSRQGTEGEGKEAVAETTSSELDAAPAKEEAPAEKPETAEPAAAQTTETAEPKTDGETNES